MIRQSLDAGVALQFLLADDPEKYAKVEKLLRQPDVRFEIADSAIMEMVFVMENYYKFTRAQVEKALSILDKVDNMCYNRNLFHLVMKEYLDNPKLSFGECCLAKYAGLNEAVPLWTFDKNLAKQSLEAEEIK
ncbi:MAG: hypothetical protein LBM97_00130 [Candidatus Nomurabacteria bacterium]|jgi:predicted nucleic-acid-binding protein|nr:hypothetical protein [Candidatus Nomurabacteria bacterium]